MAQAVDAAHKLATEGDCVVLSPACASFDLYRNFEERGSFFVERGSFFVERGSFFVERGRFFEERGLLFKNNEYEQVDHHSF